MNLVTNMGQLIPIETRGYFSSVNLINKQFFIKFFFKRPNMLHYNTSEFMKQSMNYSIETNGHVSRILLNYFEIIRRVWESLCSFMKPPRILADLSRRKSEKIGHSWDTPSLYLLQ